MSKPTTLPEWASSAIAGITEPSTLQKQSGWAVRQKPPAQYLNWWQKLVYQWIVWLDGLTNEALTWAAGHIFSAGIKTDTVDSTGATDLVLKRNGSTVASFGSASMDAAARKITNLAAPSAGTSDAATTTYVDNADSTHAALTNPHSATSAATASRLVVRDANAGAAFAKVTSTAVAGDSPAIEATGHGNAHGIVGTAGASGFAGVSGVGAGGTGIGVRGEANTFGVAGFTTDGSGIGVTGNGTTGIGVSGNGNPGVQASSNGATRGALNLVPQSAPSAPQNGDMWVETGTNTLKVRINGVTKTVTIT